MVRKNSLAQISYRKKYISCCLCLISLIRAMISTNYRKTRIEIMNLIRLFGLCCRLFGRFAYSGGPNKLKMEAVGRTKQATGPKQANRA